MARKKVVEAQSATRKLDVELSDADKLNILWRIADKFNHADIRNFRAQIEAERANKETE